jgi:hypothetical protein
MARIEFIGDNPVTGSADFFVQDTLDVQGKITNSSGSLILSSSAGALTGTFDITDALTIGGVTVIPGVTSTQVTGSDDFFVQNSLDVFGKVTNVSGSLILSSSDSTVVVSGSLMVLSGTSALPVLYLGPADASGLLMKKESGVIKVRLGDDSNYASFYVLTLSAAGAVTAGSTQRINWGSRSELYSPTNGDLLLTNDNVEQMLLFGGDASGSITAPSSHLILSSSAGSQVTVSGNLAVQGQVWSNGVYEYTPTAFNQTIDWNNGNTQRLNLTSVTGSGLTASFVNGKVGSSYVLFVKQHASAPINLSCSSASKWPGGVPPVISVGLGSEDVLTFVHDGVSYYGNRGPAYS